MIAFVLSGLLLASPTAPNPDPAVPAEAYIVFKQADYGPSWGHYRSLLNGMRQYCGDQSAYCEVYCPKDGFGKRCHIVYACGEHVTKITEARAGEILVLECRTKQH